MSSPTGPAAGLPSPPPFDAADQARVQLAVTYHQTARAEIIQRITNRDNVLFLYLAAASALFGVAFSEFGPGAGILLIVPLLGVGAAFTHAQHNVTIGALASYLTQELGPTVGRAFQDERPVPLDWDSSEAQGSATSIVRWRFWSSLSLIALPEAAAVAVFGASVDDLGPFPIVALSVMAWAFIGVSVLVLVRSHRERLGRIRPAADQVS